MKIENTMAARPESFRPSNRSIESLRVPPNAIEAEQAVLGGLMLAPESWDKVADKLVEGDFYRHDHQLIFRAIGELQNKSTPADAVTLGEWFETQGIAELVGGSSYILELANNTFTPAPPPNQLSDFQLGNGAMLLIEPNGRCTLSGEKIPDSPQRFRLPEGAKNIRFGPQTRLAAW